MVTPPFRVEDALTVIDDLEPYITRLEKKAGGEQFSAIKRKVASGCYGLHAVGEDSYMLSLVEDGEFFVVSAGAFSLQCKSIEEYISDTIKYAKKCNCYKISFSSTRRAWHRIAPRMGFGSVENIFSKEI